MDGGRHAGNYGNVIWIGEAWHHIHSDRGEAFRHQPLEVGKDTLRQTCMYIGWITAVDEDYHHWRPRPLIGLAVHLDLLRMILRGEFEAREQQSQADGCCKSESSSHCRAPLGDLLQSNYLVMTFRKKEAKSLGMADSCSCRGSLVPTTSRFYIICMFEKMTQHQFRNTTIRVVEETKSVLTKWRILLEVKI